MTRCCIISCKNRHERKYENISFHRFPKEPFFQCLWIKATGRKKWFPKEGDRICSKHFESRYLRTTNSKTFLSPNAIPTFFIKSKINMRDILSSNDKMRLRSGGYKCSLCGRRVVDAALLERHLKTVHNISKGRKIMFKPKPKAESDVEEEKGVAARTAKEIKPAQSDSQNENDSMENVENERNQPQSAKKAKRKVEFQCPACPKMFNVYHAAHRHIQREHSINSAGDKVCVFKMPPKEAPPKKVPPNNTKAKEELRRVQQMLCRKRKYREMVSNPERLAIEREKRRNKYKKGKEDGRIKSIKELDPQAQLERRKRWNELNLKRKQARKRQRQISCRTFEPVVMEGAKETSAEAEKLFDPLSPTMKTVGGRICYNEYKKGPINSPDLVQPIRVEECVKCLAMMKSTEPHICRHTDDTVGLLSQYVCMSCNQSFISLKSFDIHVAGLHSSGVESLFFPTELEFTTWQQEMERQTQAKYSINGDYDMKKVYRCTYSRDKKTEGTTYFCPSTMIIQHFSKGIQVHFYQEHCGHPTRAYTLASKYIKYSITTFLKNPGDLNNAAINKVLDQKEMHNNFKALMESIVTDARKIDVTKLKVLVEKAREMAKILSTVDESAPKFNKSMTDKEITEALEEKSAQKRRISVDNKTAPKRSRNQLLICQDANGSPKIVNTYSLATSDVDKSDSEEQKEDTKSNKSVSDNQSDGDSNKKVLKKTNINQSPSFNDSYKDFVDKTIKASIYPIGQGRGTSDRVTRSHVVNIPTDQKIEPKSVHVGKTVTKTLKEVINLAPKTKSVAIKESVDVEDIINQKKKKLCNVTITKITPEKIDSINKSTKVYTPKITKSVTVKSEASDIDIEPVTPLSAVKVKDFKYEVREQENDCNILVLKF